jgi:hypothetical protein
MKCLFLTVILLCLSLGLLASGCGSDSTHTGYPDGEDFPDGYYGEWRAEDFDEALDFEDGGEPQDENEAEDADEDVYNDEYNDHEEEFSFETEQDSEAGDQGQGNDDSGQDEVWVKIDYTEAYTTWSPGWEFSQTPGWGPAQWAMEGDDWPEAWDRFDNMDLINDWFLGQVLEIGPGMEELQLMIGLEELVDYSSITVRIEGRGTQGSGYVDVYIVNPWNGCGVTAQIGQFSHLQVIEADLGQCFEIGQSPQAVRVGTDTGALGLMNMKVTMHQARW